MLRLLLFLLSCMLLGCGSDGGGPRTAALITAANQALTAGDTTAAMTAVNEAIEIEPSVWAYAIRAELHARSGSDDLANSDIEAGLAMDEKNEKLVWIREELGRPVDQRFEEDQPQSLK